METAIALGVAVDDLIDMPSPVETGEIEFHSWREWDDPFTMLRTKAEESDVVCSYLNEQAQRVLDLISRIPDGGTALIVGHGGWIESVVAQLVIPAEAGQLGGSFWHLDGIRLAIGPTSPASVICVDRRPRDGSEEQRA